MARTDQMKNVMAQAYADEVAEISLHSADPGTTGANEITSIPRSAIAWPDPPSAGVIVSSTGSFAVPADTVVTHVGVWNSSGDFMDSFMNNLSFDSDSLYQPSVQYTQDGE